MEDKWQPSMADRKMPSCRRLRDAIGVNAFEIMPAQNSSPTWKFLEDDADWTQAREFARAHAAPGDSGFVHDAFLRFFPWGIPYVFITRGRLKKYDWIIFHRHYVPQVGLRIMRDVLAGFEPVFANETFVIFANKKSAARKRLPASVRAGLDRKHADGLQTAVEELEKAHRRGEAIPPHWAFTALRADYGRPAIARFQERIAGRIFARRTLLVPIARGGGFFSNFNRVMSHLACSLHRDGIRHVLPDWHVADIPLDASGLIDHNFPYGRVEDGNVWEHFFEPLATAGAPAGAMITTGFADPTLTSIHAHYLYKLNGDWRRRYNAVYRKHIRVRPHIQKRVDDFHSQHMAGKYAVGLHARNDAHKNEIISGEQVAFETYTGKIEALLRTANRDAVIFLATDVEEVVEKFKSVFGDRVIVQPGVARWDAPHTGGRDDQLHHKNPNPSVKLGEDVLIDCLLLARCNAFVHSASNISTAVGYINPAIEMVYCE